jgi:hypothetical protein
MSRGPGKWQIVILRALRRPGLFPLRGRTAAETIALLRAARILEAAGQCVIVRKLGPTGRVMNYAAPPAGDTRPKDKDENSSVRRSS